ncbi:MAG TPA: NTP transferase domain-containing protein [Desulfotignum sp.]|nr:NTP transferase domain-containing protein [Desulfotignum sp.]
MDALSVIILAAGKGTRMKSDLPKVLHKVAGRSMLSYVISCAKHVTRDNIHVVVGHQAEKVRREVAVQFGVDFCVQERLLGTGDAVKSALPHLAAHIRDVLVLCGDVPLIQPKNLADLILVHRSNGAVVTVLATDLENPFGYGRIIQDAQGNMVAIREEADASASEKKIRRINTGIYCFDRSFLARAVEQLRPDNRQGEYYLTDVVDIGVKNKEKIAVTVLADHRQVLGINTLDELEKAQDLIGHIKKELP